MPVGRKQQHYRREILLTEFSNYDKVRPVLQKLARLANEETNVSADQYQGYDIYSVPVPELPAGLYGPMFTGFPRSYITYIAPYLVISNNSQVLQNYIVDYENQITWKQSPEYDSVLTNVNNEAQLSMIVNLRKAQSGEETQVSKKYSDLTFQNRVDHPAMPFRRQRGVSGTDIPSQKTTNRQ
jgi:hypothetical protein